MPGTDFARLKKFFFTSRAVQGQLDRKTRRVLSKFGAYVRREAQTSMRARKGASKPGSPPSSHATKLLRRFLFFSYDPSGKTVVIGPVRLGGTAGQHVPKVEEEGGTVLRKNRAGVATAYRYPARPYMKPAFDRHVGWVAEE